jgi:hypothetical protein
MNGVETPYRLPLDALAAHSEIRTREVAVGGASGQAAEGPLASVPPAPNELEDALGTVIDLVVRNRSGAPDGTPSAPTEIEASLDEMAGTSLPTTADVIPDELRSIILGASGDPVLCLALLDAAMKSAGVSQRVQDVHHSDRSAREAALERERAIEKAIKKASRRARLPKWLRKLVKAIATIASAVVAVMSGGAGAVALAGMVLLLCAKHIGKLAVQLGMDPQKAKWLVVGLQAVGAAMSIVAGGVGATSLASSAAQLARDTVNIVGSTVGAVGQVLEGGYDIANAVFQKQADMAQAGADRAGVRFDAAQLGLDDAIAVLRDGLNDLARGLEVSTDTLRLRDEARRATLERAV